LTNDTEYLLILKAIDTSVYATVAEAICTEATHLLSEGQNNDNRFKHLFF